MAGYDPDKHHRKSIRLPHYDYTQAGAYFVTICAHNRKCLFGEIVDGQPRLNENGRIVAASWQVIPSHFENVKLDAHVVMPNHIHGIIFLVGAKHFCSPKNASPSSRRVNVQMAHNQDRWVRSFRISNQFRRAGSTNYAKPTAKAFGSAIITNALYAVSHKWMPFEDTF
jgi:REP element-mobilizing transposase RayT